MISLILSSKRLTGVRLGVNASLDTKKRLIRRIGCLTICLTPSVGVVRRLDVLPNSYNLSELEVS